MYGNRKLYVWALAWSSYTIVLSNLGLLLRTSWIWVALVVLVRLGLNQHTAGIATADGTFEKLFVSTLHLSVNVVLLASVAVMWHRVVLLEERPQGFLYVRFDRTVLSYCAYGLALVLIQAALEACVIGAGNWLGFIAPFVIGFVFFRCMLVLPAAAIDAPMTIWESWDLTDGNGWRLLAASLVTGLPLMSVVIILALYGVDPKSQLFLTILYGLGTLLVLSGITMMSEAYRLLVGAPSPERHDELVTPPSHTQTRPPQFGRLPARGSRMSRA